MAGAMFVGHGTKKIEVRGRPVPRNAHAPQTPKVNPSEFPLSFPLSFSSAAPRCPHVVNDVGRRRWLQRRAPGRPGPESRSRCYKWNSSRFGGGSAARTRPVANFTPGKTFHLAKGGGGWRRRWWSCAPRAPESGARWAPHPYSRPLNRLGPQQRGRPRLTTCPSPS